MAGCPPSPSLPPIAHGKLFFLQMLRRASPPPSLRCGESFLELDSQPSLFLPFMTVASGNGRLTSRPPPEGADGRVLPPFLPLDTPSRPFYVDFSLFPLRLTATFNSIIFGRLRFWTPFWSRGIHPEPEVSLFNTIA